VVVVVLLLVVAFTAISTITIVRHQPPAIRWRPTATWIRQSCRAIRSVTRRSDVPAPCSEYSERRNNRRTQEAKRSAVEVTLVDQRMAGGPHPRRPIHGHSGARRVAVLPQVQGGGTASANARSSFEWREGGTSREARNSAPPRSSRPSSEI